MNTKTVSVADVIVPEGRFREANPKKVEQIAESFLKFGQLQPIIIDRDMRLVDGLHRLTAMQDNGATEIDAIFRDEVDELFLREMELEANIQRQEVTWLEREKAIAHLHTLKQLRDPTWTQQKTQATVSAARQADVSEAIKLTKMIELFPEIAKAKSKNQAMSWMKAKARTVTRTLDVQDSPPDLEFIQSKIILGDSVDVIKTIPDESFHAIITDPPFGIGFDDRSEGSIGSLTSYKDDEARYRRLLTMAPDLYRVIKPNGWLIWFLGHSWLDEVRKLFRATGFVVDEIPLVWDRSEGRSFTVRPDRYFGKAYDIALHCIKGDPQIVQRGKSNIIRVAPLGQSEKELLVERPVELYQELIRRLTLPNEIVADFFVGSGSCPAAAASLGRDFFGVEQSEERRAYALNKIKMYIPEKK